MNNTISIFSQPIEKGQREWGTLRPVRHDRVGMFRVLSPRKADTPRYTNTVPIKRYPRRLILKTSHS